MWEIKSEIEQVTERLAELLPGVDIYDIECLVENSNINDNLEEVADDAEKPWCVIYKDDWDDLYLEGRYHKEEMQRLVEELINNEQEVAGVFHNGKEVAWSVRVTIED